jgi:hypothetical protein
MSLNQWQVEGGLGESLIGAISADVRDLGQFDPAVFGDESRASDDTLNREAQAAGREVVDAAIAAGTVADLLDAAPRIDPEQQQKFSAAYLARLAIERYRLLVKGRPIILDGSDRVWLTTTAPGVSRNTGFYNRYTTLVQAGESRWRTVEPGISFEGILLSLNTLPREGGLLFLEHRVFSSFIRGVVDPITGEPRVNMEYYKQRSGHQTTPLLYGRDSIN